jgi:predicted amidohydrolase
MYLSLVQFAPDFGNKESNIKKIHNFIDNTNTDIIVFPELALTGYDFKDRNEVMKYADDFESPVIQEVAEKAQQQNKIIIFGFPEKSDNGKNLFNSAAALFPDKELNTVYRKTHLFFRERFCFDEGDTGFFNIYYKKWDLNIGLMICYDWRFPEAARTLALKGADLIVSPSNLVTNVWEISSKSRALENKVYLAVANRIGTENRNGNELLFNGKSVIYKYNAEEIAKASSEQEQIITAKIEPQNTRKKSFNEYNDIFSDRRPKFYL